MQSFAGQSSRRRPDPVVQPTSRDACDLDARQPLPPSEGRPQKIHSDQRSFTAHGNESITVIRSNAVPAHEHPVGWLVSAGLVATALSLSTNFAAVAAGTCLESPDRQPDPGTHWYYRSDPVSHQRCWYLK